MIEWKDTEVEFVLFKDLLELTKDGEWGKDEESDDSIAILNHL
jgi:hypothetical protein